MNKMKTQSVWLLIKKEEKRVKTSSSYTTLFMPLFSDESQALRFIGENSDGDYKNYRPVEFVRKERQ